MERPTEKVVNALRTKGCNPVLNGDHYTSRCPAHDDENPSLSVREGESGNALVKCFAGCPNDAVVAALDLTLNDLFLLPNRAARRSKAKHPTGQIIARYRYVDADGHLQYVAVRYADPKDFRLERPDGTPGVRGVLRILYNAPLLARADMVVTVFIVEGEKDADAGAAIGLLTTCNPGGAGMGERLWADPAFAHILEGRPLVIVSDWDDAGRKHALHIHEQMMGRAASVRIVRAAVGNDLADHLAAGHTPDDLVPVPLDDLRSMVASALPVSATSPSANPRQSPRPKMDDVLALLTGIELFHDAAKQPYVTLDVDGRTETLRIPSTALTSRLRLLAHRHIGKLPSAATLDECVDLLAARAVFDGQQHEVHYRIARYNEMIYFDLGDDARTIIQIDAEGWRTTDTCPIRFERSSSMRPHPLPIQNGSLAWLDSLNVKDDTARRLMLISLIGAFRPTGPYAVTSIQGPYGSAKTTAAEMLRTLIDPVEPLLRSAPTSEDDLIIAASRSHVIGFDNLSTIAPWLSDALCRVATGGGFGKRRLYSDADEIVFSVERPVIFTSIEEVITRGDLLDRAIIIEMARITPGRRKPIQRVREEFENARPALLGALLDAVSTALRREPTVAIRELPRLADPARWACAAAPALGLTQEQVIHALTHNRQSSHWTALGDWIASPAVIDLLQRHTSWTGTPTDLLNELTRSADVDVRSNRRWPSTAAAVSNKLKNLAPDFAAVGIDIDFDRSGKARVVELRRNAQHVVTAVTTVTDTAPHDAHDDHDDLIRNDEDYTEADAAEAAQFRATHPDAIDYELF